MSPDKPAVKRSHPRFKTLFHRLPPVLRVQPQEVDMLVRVGHHGLCVGHPRLFLGGSIGRKWEVNCLCESIRAFRLQIHHSQLWARRSKIIYFNSAFLVLWIMTR